MHAAPGDFGPDGPVGEIRWPAEIPFEPITMDITVSGRTVSVSVPFSPRSTWVTTHSGAILTGASDRYHFQVQSAEGTVLAVEKYWTPVPVEADEADWIRRRTIAGFRREGGGPEWNWDGAEMPTTKPAFSSLIAAHTGEIWVRREGPGERLADCAEDPIAHGIEAASEAPCWRSSTIIDAFDAEGRLLGEVEAPAGLRAFPAYLQVRGDQVVSVVEDDAGIIRVKRWRLVPPG